MFAIGLKRVVFPFLKPRDADNSRLEKASLWRLSSDNRSAGGEFSEIVEASLDGFASSEEDKEEHESGVAELADDDIEYYVTTFGAYLDGASLHTGSQSHGGNTFSFLGREISRERRRMKTYQDDALLSSIQTKRGKMQERSLESVANLYQASTKPHASAGNGKT